MLFILLSYLTFLIKIYQDCHFEDGTPTFSDEHRSQGLSQEAQSQLQDSLRSGFVKGFGLA
jgi:hypothetical protein